MAIYNISINAAGSKKDNDASREIAALFPYSAGSYRTISLLTRKGGIWCNTGGASQRVVLSVYDQLINTATGAVIKTSNTAECSCHGSGPAAENYATTTFANWTQAESNAATAAWAAGTLRITRTATVKSYTSSKHGQPSFRDGFYDDVITIQGSTAPFTDYRPVINTFEVMRSDDGLAQDNTSQTVYATIKLSMNNTAGLDNSPSLTLYYSTDDDFASDTQVITLGTTRAQIQPYLNQSSLPTKLNATFSMGSNYYFKLVFKAGEEVAEFSGRSVPMSYVPIHIPENNAGVAVGGYSNATPTDQRFECHYPAYLYGGIAQIGDGTNTLSMLGIQRGSHAAESVNSSATKEIAVTFPRAYAEVPTVIANIISTSTSYYLGRCNVAIQSVSKTGFTARIANGGSSAVVFGFNWIAAGK